MFTPESIKSLFLAAVQHVTAHIHDFSFHPGKDFSRFRKFSVDTLIRFLVAQGSSSTKVELLDFFDFDSNAPSSSAFCQQRAKLKPEAIQETFDVFNASLIALEQPVHCVAPGYRCLAVDGSSVSFYSTPRFSPEDYFVSQGHSIKGFYSLHVNALFDIDRHLYTDVELQSVHAKDEFRAFCSMADRQPLLPETKDIYIGDRGYCSYNNMAHVLEKGQYFLFRSKDVLSKGILKNLGLPTEGVFDETVTITVTRRKSKRIQPPPGSHLRFIGQDISFDYVEYGSDDTYTMTFRVVRIPLPSGSYECLVTNLPREEFPPERLAELYFSRWQIECAYRDLKYTIGMDSFHSCKAMFIEQEVLARLLLYNITEALVQSTVVENGDTKHEYKVNFTSATHICRAFLRKPAGKDQIDTAALLRRELIPIRGGRSYPRLQTAHFRRPKYFAYRAA
ncbi:MAG: IS4 family transposase [Eubacteriales bacterium]|nr:IS4 family transposase [Eubacteriales bacterium]